MFHRMSEPEFDQVLAVHPRAASCQSRAAPHFAAGQRRLRAHDVDLGLIGNFGQANYSAAKLGIVGLSKSIALDMQKFGVRSNAVAPFAWTRMIDSIPNETPEQKRRVEGLKKLVPERVAPFVVGLCADAASDVSGQIFGVRNNEIYLFSQPRSIRSAHCGEGWTPEGVIETALPMLRADFSRWTARVTCSPGTGLNQPAKEIRMSDQKKVIITCAVTGSIHTPSMSPYLPVTAQEIADAAVGAFEAGAASSICMRATPSPASPTSAPRPSCPS
jgi:hypothetical protein